MHILYSCPLDPGHKGGAGGHITNVAQELTHLRHAVTLVHMGQPIPGLEGVRQMALARSFPSPLRQVWRNVGLAQAIARSARSDHYDLLYHRFDKVTLLPLILAQARRMPTVVEVNSDLRSEQYIVQKSWLQRKLIAWVEKANYRLARHVIVVAEGIKHSICTLYDIPSEKVSVIPNGTDLHTFRPLDRGQCCQLLGLDLARKYVAFTGAFQSWQGLEAIAQSAVRLRETHPEAIYLLVGDGPERARIEALIHALGVSASFHLPGWCSPDQTALYLGAADVCVAPYMRDAAAVAGPAENTRGAMMRRSPLKIYTYLAAGRPVVASDFAEAGLLVEELRAGIAIPPERPDCLAKAICHILENPQQAERMGRAARQVAEERFGWRAVAERVADVCEQVRRAHAH